MPRYEDACPFEANARAARCKTCCAANSVAPCVAAYLSGRAVPPSSNVIAIRRVETAETLRAA